jgi:hypothetical protein
MLAACGALAALEDAGNAVRLHWRHESGWHPVFTCDLDRENLCQQLAEAFLTPEAIVCRQYLDAALAVCVAAEETMLASSQRIEALGNPTDKAGKIELKEAKEAEKKAKEGYKLAKANVGAAESSCDVVARAAVGALHPVTTKAQHLDNIAKGGLSAISLREVEPGRSYLAGLAACIEQTVKVQGGYKTMIARSTLSFANNNSGKALLKDFAGVACYATPSRVMDALFGTGKIIDRITGLGWDPAS